jgi:hypothetical protein
MKKAVVLACACFFSLSGTALADEYFLHFSGLSFQGPIGRYFPPYGLVFWNGDTYGGDAVKNLLICPADFRYARAFLRSMTIRYYDNDPDRHIRIRLVRMSIDTGLTEVQAEWNSALIGETGWTTVDSYIYNDQIDNREYSYWIEALLFGPLGNASPAGYLIALQSVRINYFTPSDSNSR